MTMFDLVTTKYPEVFVAMRAALQDYGLCRWIACAERLPTKSGTYITHGDNPYNKHYLDADGDWENWNECIPTHWLEIDLPPVPEAPK